MMPLIASDFGLLGVFLLLLILVLLLPAVLITLLWPFARNPANSRRSYRTYIVFTVVVWILTLGGIYFFVLKG